MEGATAIEAALGAGEVAESDTRLPHWFGSAAGRSAEVLSPFGSDGESAQVRAESEQHARRDP